MELVWTDIKKHASTTVHGHRKSAEEKDDQETTGRDNRKKKCWRRVSGTADGRWTEL